MTVRNSSRPIALVFRATAAPGCRDELLKRFHSSSAALVNSKARGALNIESSSPQTRRRPKLYLSRSGGTSTRSVWRFGDAWQQSHLPEGYSALMTACSVHHFLVSESSTTEQFASHPRT